VLLEDIFRAILIISFLCKSHKTAETFSIPRIPGGSADGWNKVPFHTDTTTAAAWLELISKEPMEPPETLPHARRMELALVF